MIYGDQSQEGFLLRDYFCCDTNELRLQTHCRPITLEKRLRAYYAQIISRLFSSALLRSTFGVFTPCPNVYSHVHGVCCTRKRRRAGGLLSAPPPPPPPLSALLIYHCCIVLPGSFTQLYLSVHQYATYACVRLRPGSPA